MNSPTEVTAADLSPEMLAEAAAALGVSEEDLLNDPGCQAPDEEADE